MDKRKYIALRRKALLLSLLRFWALLAVGIVCWYGVTYVMRRSEAEVAEVKERPESEYYITVDQEVRMTVVDDTGGMSMEISGDSVKLTNDQKSAIFTGAEATYFKDGEEEIRMAAGQIEYDTETEDFLIRETPGQGDLWVETRDGMRVEAAMVEWRAVLVPPGMGSKATRVPAFRFPKGVEVVQKKSNGSNTISANYMQADKELTYMEFVGDVHGTLDELQDTEFISERELTDVATLDTEDFETLAFRAEKVIYDKRLEIVTATSRFYDRSFTIFDMDGREVDVTLYQDVEMPVTFSKAEITIECNHLEAHVEKKWANCIGNIEILVPPDQPEPGDDKALQSVKKFETRISAGDVEYFWGRDFILTHTPTRVVQEDRLALADRITYWGDNKMVLLDGDITMVQGSGSWLVEDDLVSVEDHDMERAVTAYTELYSDRAVVYLDNNDFIASGAVRVSQDERDVAADTIVYQDDIKRITAQGNIKFIDQDGQALLCRNLVFHNDSDFLEVSGGASASLRLPAKYANDINRALAETREQEVPAEIEDPPVEAQPPSRNPNSRLTLKELTAITPAGSMGGSGASGSGGGLRIPGQQGSAPPAGDGEELLLEIDSDEATEPEEPPSGEGEEG